jgi:transcription antitermination factor NusG
MNLDGNQKFWFALQVRAKYEFIASEMLRAKGYEEFVPSYRCRRQWSDRVKELELPLFPGYVFCRFNGVALAPVVTTPGVTRFVMRGANELATISDEEIQAIRNALKHDMSVMPWTEAAIGKTVQVRSGPLAGVGGILTGFKNRNYLVITIEAIQRSVAVPAEQCELVSSVTPQATAQRAAGHQYR